MKRPALFLSLLLLFCSGVRAQDMAANSAHILTVTLGQSSAALTGPWKFHTGDDPR